MLIFVDVDLTGVYGLGDSDDGAIMDSDEDGLDTSDLGEIYILHTFSSPILVHCQSFAHIYLHVHIAANTAAYQVWLREPLAEEFSWLLSSIL